MEFPDNIPTADAGPAAGETPTRLGPARGRDGPTLRLESAGPEPEKTASRTVVVHGAKEGEQTYQILQEIGRGGMSVVYLARDVKLGRFVALKRLGAAFRANPSMKERFFREARLIAALNHIHIVRLFDFDEDEKGPFIVMEYVPGPGKALLPDRPPPSLNLEWKVEQNQAALWPREAVSLVRKLCGAIDYAHRRGVIHRDLKPSNVLLDEFGEPRVVDFGLARQAQAQGEKITLTGTRLLSLGYGAPEQEEDAGRADERSDIYSLGGILYFCLTGENPRFFRDSRVPDFLRPALLKALERDANLRWTSAAEFSEALSQSAADYLSPLTDVGMWRCKWCNALNPLSSRYCHQCQWDGMERCPECEGETRVGVRFCGTCGTDIKAFEDMQGLVRRLRELRHQKDFGRIREAAESAARFQARGPKGLEILRQIAELGETANWAAKRKDEISQAITSAMERENFEAVRERLNEYELLADGDEYEALRKELPWRVAERDLVALRTDVNRARELLGRKELGECRLTLEAVRVRRLHLSRLEVQFPILQGLFAGAEAPADASGANEFARELGSVLKDVERIERGLAAAEEKVAKLLEEAKDALRLQDYVRCAAACRGIQDITVDSSDADVILAEAVSAQQQIEKRLVQAEQALSSGRYPGAARMCRRILDRYKQDCAEANDLLVRIAQSQRRRSIRVAIAAVVLTAGLYVVSVAPAHQAVESGLATTVSKTDLRRFYAPVFWLHDHTFLRWPLEAYAEWWGLRIF